MEKYDAIGLMSGTSLDGLDIAACEFLIEKGKWSFKIPFCKTYPYSEEWKEKLAGSQHLNGLELSIINTEYGHLLGKLAKAFLDSTGFKPDLIASHGHTVFHQPGKGLTVQIGAGSAIAAETGMPVVCDFRSLDVAMGGQGAPLVPIGDRLLFAEYDACLNLGGFANISMEFRGKRIAFDICPANIILNKLATRVGMDYDIDGLLAKAGKPDHVLFQQLNNLPFYKLSGPKSLGREWLEENFLPLIENHDGAVNDLISTVTEHIAFQVNRSLDGFDIHKVLVTGGGAHNKYLLSRIRKAGSYNWTVISDNLSDFKEALVFAFLGILRVRGEINVLCSVTGSSSDHSGGAIYRPISAG